MKSDKESEKGTGRWTWVVIGAVMIVFVGARQVHPGGIRGLIGDSTTAASSSNEIRELHAQMLEILIPMGAAAICQKSHRNDPQLRDAVVDFNDRNQAAMKELIASVEAAGGMSKSEKDLLDRQAFREGSAFVGEGAEMERTCSNLASRFASGEFDVPAAAAD